MKIEKLRNILLFLVFIFSFNLFFPMSVLAGTSGNSSIFPDVQNHWAQKSINIWVERGYIGGYPNGKFMPNNPITRAEFCALINRVFGYNRISFLNFSDVPAGKWYSKEIGKAVAAGYLSNYAGGEIRPNDEITRQEVAVILTKILSLKNVQVDRLYRFKDLGDLSFKDSLAINTVVNNNYMKGYPNRMLQPARGMTRAEALTILDRVVGSLYDRPGTYGLPYDTIVLNGNVTINTSNVTLRNVIITGNLYLTEGIGDGYVTLVDVKVKGVTKASGGTLMNNCDLSSLVADTTNSSKIRLLAQGTTRIGSTDVRAEAKLEEANLVGTGFNDVVFNVSQGAKLELKGAFKKVDVEAPKVKLDFLQGTIDNLTLSLAAQDAKVNLASNAYIKNLKVINKAAITGLGTIGTTDVYANGVTFESVPRTIKLASGVSTTVRGKTVTGTQSSSSSSSWYNYGNKKIVPLFVDDYPRTTNVQTTGFDILLKADEHCRAYYVVLNSGEKVPSAEQVMAGEDATDRLVTSNRRGCLNLRAYSEKRVSIKNLGEDVRYNVFVVLESIGVSVEPAVTKLTVRTAEAKYGHITGKVTGPGREALSGVTVKIKSGSAVLMNVTTKSDGTYSIRDLRPGTYTLEFSKKGYEQAQITNVVVTANKTTSFVNKTLKLEVLTLDTADPPAATEKEEYPGYTFTARNGILPYSFVITAGALPEGMTLAADGKLSGTPTKSGKFTFTVAVIDSAKSAATDKQKFTLVVEAEQPVTVE
ncbi:MAG: S-layer homology domain-containing protein [Peptococcia bacterium]|jgi:hypothetical protein